MGVDIYEICNITEDDLRRLFVRHKTVTKVAKVLGASRKTVGKYARMLGVPLVNHRPQEPGRPRLVSGYGAVVRWLKDHPGERLPADLGKAAAMLGVSRKTLYSYIHYRKARFNRYIASLPPLSSLDRVVPDTEGRPVPLRRLVGATASIDIKTMQVLVRGQLGAAARVTLKMSLERFEGLFRLPPASGRD